MNIVTVVLVVAGIVCMKKAGSLSKRAQFSSLVDEHITQKTSLAKRAGRFRIFGIVAWIAAGVLWVGVHGF